LLQIATPAQLLGRRRQKRPATISRRIEADDANRVFILAGQQVENDGLELGRFDVGFAPDPAEPTEIVHQLVDVVNRRRWARSRGSSWTYAYSKPPLNRIPY